MDHSAKQGQEKELVEAIRRAVKAYGGRGKAVQAHDKSKKSVRPRVKLSEAEREQIVQEAYVRALESLKKGNVIKDWSKLGGWVSTTVQRTVVDHIRKAVRHRRGTAPLVEDQQVPAVQPTPSQRAERPEEEAERWRQYEKALGILDQLKPDEKLAFEVWCFEFNRQEVKGKKWQVFATACNRRCSPRAEGSEHWESELRRSWQKVAKISGSTIRLRKRASHASTREDPHQG